MAASCFLAVATHFQLFLPIYMARIVPRQRNFYELMGFKALFRGVNAMKGQKPGLRSICPISKARQAGGKIWHGQKSVPTEKVL